MFWMLQLDFQLIFQSIKWMRKIYGRVQGLEACEFELINALKGSINLAPNGEWTHKAPRTDKAKWWSFSTRRPELPCKGVVLWAAQLLFPFNFGVKFTTTSSCYFFKEAKVTVNRALCTKDFARQDHRQQWGTRFRTGYDIFVTWASVHLSISNEFMSVTDELQKSNDCWLLLDQTSFWPVS